MRSLLPATVLLACPLALLWPQAAGAEVRRCVTTDEKVVFTDRACGEIGAVERAPRHDAVGGARLHQGCARTVQDLVFGLGAAIDGRDANRLAALYHWPGLSASAGYAVLARLQAIAALPLVDIVPVLPVPPAEPAMGAVGGGRRGEWEELPLDPPPGPPPPDPGLYPQTAIRQEPVGLRIEQTLANGATPARTEFGLTRHFGCWWVRF